MPRKRGQPRLPKTLMDGARGIQAPWLRSWTGRLDRAGCVPSAVNAPRQPRGGTRRRAFLGSANRNVAKGLVRLHSVGVGQCSWDVLSSEIREEIRVYWVWVSRFSRSSTGLEDQGLWTGVVQSRRVRPSSFVGVPP